MIDWDYFVKVRKIDTAKWLKKLDITTYAKYIKCVKSLGVKPISQKEFEVMLPKKIEQKQKAIEAIPVVLEKNVDKREKSVLDDVREKKTKKKVESVETE